MFQKHPLDPNGRLLRRFYEPLILLAVLDRTRGAQRPDLITDRGLDEPSKLWRNFLDQLSWLCDSEPGGDTVTAVAAQRTVECNLFWVAANSKSRYKAQMQLKWVFEQLNRLCTDPGSNLSIENEIIARCTEFSSQRIRTYTKWLLEAITEGRKIIQAGVSAEDQILMNELEAFKDAAENAPQLCNLAYNARRHDFMQILGRKHQAHSSRGVWSDIRHYIGRLGSWNKAVRIIIQCALRFPQRIENAQIKIVDPSEPTDRPDKRHLTETAGMIKRMLSADQAGLAAELIQAITEIDAVTDLHHCFREKYVNFKPRPHAELLVLEHFYQNSLEYLADDNYIGCSKPSCYCCHLYMEHHPGMVSPRPCHGNLWTNWAPPIPLPLIDRQRTPRKPQSRPQEHHTFKIIQKMIPDVRRDVLEQILSKRPKRQKLPDSTTGMSSVVWTAAQRQVIEESDISDLMLFHYSQGFNDSTTPAVSDNPRDGDTTTSKMLVEHSDSDGDRRITITRENSVQGEDKVSEQAENSREDSDPESSIRSCTGKKRSRSRDTEDDDVLLFKGRRGSSRRETLDRPQSHGSEVSLSQS